MKTEICLTKKNADTFNFNLCGLITPVFLQQLPWQSPNKKNFSY